MRVKEAVSKRSSDYNAKNKFSALLKSILLEHPEEEYSSELFSDCFDKAVEECECQFDTKKSTHLYNGLRLCDEHFDRREAEQYKAI